jgi:DNA-binding LacI/PurR family transcriptional regulator
MYANVPVVWGDGAQWVAKALDHLVALGRRRVAVIDHGMGPRFDALLQAGLAERGMVSHRRWHQYVSLRTLAGTSNAVEMMMHDPERPDALLVEDDNFVEQALAGLAAAGMNVPDEVAVVGHANFPVAPTKVLPVRLLGYDVNLLLRTCVDLIDRQRAGEQVPGATVMPMLWEEEVSGQWAVGSRQSGLVTSRSTSDLSGAESRSGIPARPGQAGMPDLLSNKKSVARSGAGKQKMELAVS